MRQSLDGWRAGQNQEWEVALEGGATRLKMTLERLDGLDPHDWMQELGMEYGSREKVIDAIIELVMLEANVVEDASALAQWIRASGKIGE
jgi:hypothetical protein